ncbi:uncharacterized protein LOC143881785 [Tasmannia lanceolata]|uniref:uncharacterized protein LOC143881785 n=1 Tax=Tasmannia lanceolata TaxID=3420 RepID=UPI0040630C50
MMEDALFVQLHKLPTTISEETLENVLETLWKTRKSGLNSLQKSYIHSLLNLPSIEELDPVVACLRSLVRKCVHESLTGDDIQKLFPLDLPLELQSILVLILHKYQNQWKDEFSRDQPPWQRTRVSHQVKVNTPPTLTTFTASEISTSMWPRKDDATYDFNRNNLGVPLIVTDSNLQYMASVPLQRDDGPPDNLVTLPRLKSMTWTMENRNSTPANRVAVISLKLQDYTKTRSGETEVKFQLSRDTLEAMLRSMAYINEQLSNIVGPPSEPSQKKQRQ